MNIDAKDKVEKQVAGHKATEEEDLSRLRMLSMEERGQLIKAACEASAEIERSRYAAGLPPIKPDPWPESTWEFLRKHATHAQR
jgi:hypothetical protein